MPDHSSPSRWVTRASIALGLTTGGLIAIAAAASDWSYWVWSRAGIAGAVLLMASPVTGLVMLAVEKLQERRRDVMWPGLLILVTGPPMLVILVAGYILRF